MNIIFYNRNFSGTILLPNNFHVSVDRYSHAMIGGPETAYFKVQPLADKWELTKLLRCPVEIYGDDGGVKWWGFVNRIVIPHGKITLSLGLDEVSNTVTVRYNGSTTSAAIDTESVSEYGTKEFFINLSNADLTTATNERDRYLHEHHFPISRRPALSVAAVFVANFPQLRQTI